MSEGQRDNERPWCDGVRSSAEAAKSELVSDASRVRAAAEEADRRLRPILNHREPRFGDLLRDLRERSGRTMGDVAIAMAWGVPYVSAIESNKCSPPPLAEVSVVAAFLGLDAKDVNALADAALAHEPFELPWTVCSICDSRTQVFLGARMSCAGCSHATHLEFPVMLHGGLIKRVLFERRRWRNADGTEEWRWRRA